MSNILCRICGFFKYILFAVSLGLVLYGIMVTFGRLEKPLTDGMDVFVPFGIVLVMFIITIFSRSRSVRDNLFFNFVCVITFIVTIIVCVRSMFDTNMILFYRYGIDYNPTFLADNLSAICAMMYMIAGANFLLLLCDLINRKRKDKKVVSKEENDEIVKVKEETVKDDVDEEVALVKKTNKKKSVKKDEKDKED